MGTLDKEKNSHDKRTIVFLILPLSIFYLLLFFNQGINFYDEGLTLYGAERILNGDIPYKDFWTIYTPAQFYVLAGLFKLFGISIFAARFWSVIIRVALLIFTYLIARKIVSRKFAVCAWLFMLVWIGSYQVYANPMPSALLFGLMSSFCLFQFFSDRRVKWLILCGVLVGITTLFRYDIGLYIFLAEIIVIALFMLTNLGQHKSSFLERVLQTSKLCALFLLGFALVLLPTLLSLFHSVPMTDLKFDFITFPLQIYPIVRSLPYPAPFVNPSLFFSGEVSFTEYIVLTLNRLPFFAPIMVYLLIIVIFMGKIKKRKIDWTLMETWGTIFLVFLGMIFFNHARVRSDLSHLMATFVPAIILFALFQSWIPKEGKLRTLGICLAFLVGVSFIGASVYKTQGLLINGLLSSSKFYLELERGRGIYTVDEIVPVYQDAIEYIQLKVPEDEKIFVGEVKHDWVFNNDIMFYFLSKRQSATKYHDLHPGITTTAAIQKIIVSDLERQRVRYIVLRDKRRKKPHGLDLTGSNILDDFIQNDFVLDRTFGDHTVWRRR